MNQTCSYQMGSDLTAKHFRALVSILHAVEKSNFYLRQNQCMAIVIPEVDKQ